MTLEEYYRDKLLEATNKIIMELHFFTFANLDEYNEFVKLEKLKGKNVIPVSVIPKGREPQQAFSDLVIYYYYQ